MPRSKVGLLFRKFLSFLRLLVVAYMVGIANIVKQESKFMEDTFVKTELVEEHEDDEPLEED